MDKNIKQPSPGVFEKLPKSNRLKVWVHVFGGVVIVLLLFVSGFFQCKYLQIKKEPQIIESETKEDKSAFDYTGIPEEVEKEFEKILSGQIDFKDKKGNIPYYSSDFDLSKSGGIWLSFEVFKYFSGARYEDGYEGFTWTVNLDDIIANLNKLKFGKQFAPLIEEGIGGSSETEVKYKQLGKNNWAIYETFFPPSASEHRQYWSFNRSTNLLTHFGLSMQFLETKRQTIRECYRVSTNGDFGECQISYFYPEELQQVIDDIEYNLRQVEH